MTGHQEKAGKFIRGANAELYRRRQEDPGFDCEARKWAAGEATTWNFRQAVTAIIQEAAATVGWDYLYKLPKMICDSDMGLKNIETARREVEEYNRSL